MGDLNNVADVAPEEVASSLDRIVTNRSSGVSARKELSQLLSTLAAVQPSTVASRTDMLVGLITDEKDETREAAATALRHLAAAGHDLPFGLEQLAQGETDDDAWPMGVVADVAPELARQLLRTSLVSIDSSNTDRADLLIRACHRKRHVRSSRVREVCPTQAQPCTM
ncbi:hypothetical protein ACFQJ7_11685 [Halovenus rubra]|uniref:HEAT repeat-containing protein n=1 Tax=Halovenus rubra TaxID=869890 RepID=A0ABD5XE50_9EURY